MELDMHCFQLIVTGIKSCLRTTGRSLVDSAVCRNNLKALGVLLALGADADNPSQLCRCRKATHLKVAKLLLANGAKVEPHMALLNDSPDVENARLFLQHGANVESMRAYQWETPILQAAASGNVETFQLLVHSGANLQAASPSHSNILNHALRFEKPDQIVFDIALKACPDLNIKDGTYGAPIRAVSALSNSNYLQKFLVEAKRRGLDTQSLVNQIDTK
jgi:ankyrin repeat protein